MTKLLFGQALLPQGWERNVLVDIACDGTISSVEEGATESADCEKHAIGLPGLPNLHSHAFQRAMAGLTEFSDFERGSFWSWRDLMYRFARDLDPESMEAIAAMAFVEMLETGFTRVGEFHYLHHQSDGSAYDAPAAMAQALVSAAGDAGIALTLLPVYYAASDFGGKPPSRQQCRFLSTLDSYASMLEASEKAAAELSDAIVGIAPHSLRAVSADDLTQLEKLRPAAPVHIHIAEQQKEVQSCLEWCGRRPVEFLLDHVNVDERWCIVHATHIDAEERRNLAGSGAVAGLCPITEANLGDGIFPAASFVSEGGSFGVGSDSNVRIDAAGELQLLEYGQRLSEQARNVMALGNPSTGRSIFERALAGGARALGQAACGLVEGAPADIFTLRGDSIDLIGRDGSALLDSWIFARAQLDCVWRRGTLQVRAGRHEKRDRIERAYSSAVVKLLRGV